MADVSVFARLRAFPLVVVLSSLAPASLKAEPVCPVEFCDQLGPSGASGSPPHEVRPWNGRYRQELSRRLEELCELAPGLVQRACLYRKPLFFRLQGQHYGAVEAFSDPIRGAVFFTESYFQQNTDRRYRSLAHELAHLTNVTQRLSQDSKWIDATGPALDRAHRFLTEHGINTNYVQLKNTATAIALREHKAELDSLARSYGLPGWYAATSSEEAIAEVAAGIACRDTASIRPQLVEMVQSALCSHVTNENEADRCFHQGLQAFGESRMTAAVDYFDQAMRHDPSLYEAGRLAASAQCSLGRYADVIERCDKLLAQSPADSHFREQLSSCRAAANSVLQWRAQRGR
jgi:tetratricopeptide (TPR) repeat protein